MASLFAKLKKKSTSSRVRFTPKSFDENSFQVAELKPRMTIPKDLNKSCWEPRWLLPPQVIDFLEGRQASPTSPFGNEDVSSFRISQISVSVGQLYVLKLSFTYLIVSRAGIQNTYTYSPSIPDFLGATCYVTGGESNITVTYDLNESEFLTSIEGAYHLPRSLFCSIGFNTNLRKLGPVRSRANGGKIKGKCGRFNRGEVSMVKIGPFHTHKTNKKIAILGLRALYSTKISCNFFEEGGGAKFAGFGALGAVICEVRDLYSSREEEEGSDSDETPPEFVLQEEEEFPDESWPCITDDTQIKKIEKLQTLTNNNKVLFRKGSFMDRAILAEKLANKKRLVAEEEAQRLEELKKSERRIPFSEFQKNGGSGVEFMQLSPTISRGGVLENESKFVFDNEEDIDDITESGRMLLRFGLGL